MDIAIAPDSPVYAAVTDWHATRTHAARMAAAELSGDPGDGHAGHAHPLARQALQDEATWHATGRVDRASLVACWHHYADAVRRTTHGVLTVLDRTAPEPEPSDEAAAYGVDVRAHLAAVSAVLERELQP